jgi:hypothetical protein
MLCSTLQVLDRSEDLENPPSKNIYVLFASLWFLICLLAFIWRKNMSAPNTVPGNSDETFLYVVGFVSDNDNVKVPTNRDLTVSEIGILTVTTGKGDFELPVKPGDIIKFLVPDKVEVNGVVYDV